MAVWYVVGAYISEVCDPASDEWATESTSERVSTSASLDFSVIGGYGAGGYADTSIMLEIKLDDGRGAATAALAVRARERA